MKYDLRRPCEHCPFRTDCLPGWLGESRAEEIAESVFERGESFPCHKTTEFSDEGEHLPRPDEQACAGALILSEKLERPGQMMRIAEQLGMYDRAKLDMSAPVFDDPEEFITHHTRGERPCST